MIFEQRVLKDPLFRLALVLEWTSKRCYWHATHISLMSSQKHKLTGTHLPQKTEKDIGKVLIVSAPCLPHNMVLM